MSGLNKITASIIAITTILAIAVSYFFIIPTYQHLKTASSEINSKQEQISSLQKYNQSIEKVASQKSTISDLYASSKTLVPQEPNLEEFLIELEALIAQSEIPTANFEVSALTSNSTTPAATTATNTQSVIKTGPSYQFTVDGKGTLSNIFKLYNRLMTMNRLAEISSISLNSAETGQELSFQFQCNVFSTNQTTIDGIKLTGINKLLSDASSKINNNKSYGDTIEIQKETGFGRPNPFAGY